MLARASVVLLLALLLIPADAVAAPPLLGALQDQAWGDGECGAELHWPASAAGHAVKILAVNAAAPDRALVHVNGHDVLATRRGVAVTRADRVGQRYAERWTADRVTIDIDYVVTRVCPPAHEGGEGDCENIDVAATVKASDGKRTQRTKATGSSGC